MTADYADFGTPSAIAAAIATGNPGGTAGGVPLLASPVELYSPGSESIPAGTQNQLLDNLSGGTVTAMGNYLSYECEAKAESASGSTAPFMTWIFQWWANSAGSLLLFEEMWTCPAAIAGGIILHGTGPVRGAYLSVGVTNEDGTNAMTMAQFILYGNSRPSPNINPDFRDNIGVAPSGFIATTSGHNWDGILGNWSGTLTAGEAEQLLLGGLYNGPALIGVTVSGASPDLLVTPQVYVSGFGFQDVIPPLTVGPAALTAPQQVFLPRSPLIIGVTNQNAANAVDYMITAIACNQF